MPASEIPASFIQRHDAFRPSFAAAIATLASLVLVLASCGGSDGAKRAGTRPGHDVLLVTVDTLRADFLESYAAHGVATPAITALASRGARFERAFAASSATVPSHASIMTSRFARHHSVGPFNGSSRLEGAPTLAQTFRAAEYDTAAFVSNAVLNRRTGVDQGFDHYDDELEDAEANRAIYFERRADATAGRAIDWLRAREGRPFFAWVHFQDPHGPYTPPPPYDATTSSFPLRTDRALKALRANRGRGGIPAYQELPGLDRPSEYAARYAGEIAYMDAWLGQVIDEAKRASGDRGVVIAFTADHGESLGEAGWFFQHGQGTSLELIAVPLVLAGPRVVAAVHATAVHHVDIAPTLLALAGLSPLAEAEGRSLAPLLEGAASFPSRTLFSDTPGELSAVRDDTRVRVVGPPGPPHAQLGGQRSAVFRPRTALVFEASVLGADGAWRPTEVPDERREEIFRYVDAEVRPVPAHAPSEADLERLRALGYLPPE